MTSQRLWAYHNGGKWFGLVQVLICLWGRGWVSYGGWPIGAHGALGAIFSIYSCKQLTTDDQDKCNLEPAVIILDYSMEWSLRAPAHPSDDCPSFYSCWRSLPVKGSSSPPLSPSTGHWVSSVCWSSLCSIVGLNLTVKRDSCCCCRSKSELGISTCAVR